ncbi:MAG: winged helix-turn-helix domain-containing protein [Thermoanaerobaculia bacterium]
MSSERPSSSGAPPPIAEIDRLIHEPARLLLVSCLYVVKAADFVFLSRQTGLTGGNLSSHMSRLEDAGYVRVDKKFVGKRPQTVLRLTAKGRAAFRDYRRAMTGVLEPDPEASR